MKKNIFFYSLFFSLLFVGTSPVFAMKRIKTHIGNLSGLCDLTNFDFDDDNFDDNTYCEKMETPSDCDEEELCSIFDTDETYGITDNPYLCDLFNETPEKRLRVSPEEFSETLRSFTEENIKYFLSNGIDENDLNKFTGQRDGISHVRIPRLNPEEEYKTIIIGDLHGSACALARTLLRLQDKGLLDKNFRTSPFVRVIFTGDIADRGKYSILTWYLVMKFFLLNKNSVIVCRGNHETETLASHKLFKLYLELCKEYFSENELNPMVFEKYYKNKIILMKRNDTIMEKQSTEVKCELVKKDYQKLISMFNYLPAAVYMGNLQICHGGLPYRTENPNDMLENFDDYSYSLNQTLQNEDIQKEECFKILPMEKAGLISNDFHNYKSKKKMLYRNRWFFRQSLVDIFFKDTKKRYIILRGHQHNKNVVSYLGANSRRWVQLPPETPFLLSNQPHSAYTFMCCPDIEFVRKEGFGIVTSKGHYDTWTLTAYEYEQSKN